MPICQVLPPTTPPFSNQGESDYNQMEQQEQLLELGGRESAGKMEVRGVKGIGLVLAGVRHVGGPFPSLP